MQIQNHTNYKRIKTYTKTKMYENMKIYNYEKMTI